MLHIIYYYFNFLLQVLIKSKYLLILVPIRIQNFLRATDIIYFGTNGKRILFDVGENGSLIFGWNRRCPYLVCFKIQISLIMISNRYLLPTDMDKYN